MKIVALTLAVKLLSGECHRNFMVHYTDVIMSAMTSQITSVSAVCSSRLFRCRPKKTSKLHVTGICEGNSPVTGKFPAQRASNAENVSIWWRHHVTFVGIDDVHSYNSAANHRCVWLLSWWSRGNHRFSATVFLPDTHDHSLFTATSFYLHSRQNISQR